MTIHNDPRHYGIPLRSTVYVPASQFGNATICDVIIPAKVERHRTHLISARCWLAIAIATVVTGLVMVSAWNVYAAYVDHEAHCALPRHSIPCGER